jgi:hypothetical protein
MSIDRLVRVATLRLRSIFRGNIVDRELEDELQYHLDQQAAQYVRQGMTPHAAQLEARRALGNVP